MFSAVKLKNVLFNKIPRVSQEGLQQYHRYMGAKPLNLAEIYTTIW